MADLDDPVVRANALAQAHPLSETAFRYVRAMVDQERQAQPGEDLGVWAGHALTAGYCLRRIEEDHTGTILTTFPGDLPTGLDQAARHVAGLIRTDGAEPYLLQPEGEVVALLDRMIAGEIDRRVGGWRGQVSDANLQEICEYIAWWVVKGYALCVVQRRGHSQPVA